MQNLKRFTCFLLSFLLVFSMVGNISVHALTFRSCGFYLPISIMYGAGYVSPTGQNLNKQYLSPKAYNKYVHRDEERGGNTYYNNENGFIYVTPDSSGTVKLHGSVAYRISSGTYDCTVAFMDGVDRWTNIVGNAQVTYSKTTDGKYSNSNTLLTIKNVKKGDIIEAIMYFTTSQYEYGMTNYILVGDIEDFTLTALDSNSSKINTSTTNRIELSVGDTYTIDHYDWAGKTVDMSSVSGYTSSSSKGTFDGKTITALASGEFYVYGKYTNTDSGLTFTSQNIYVKVLDNATPVINDVSVNMDDRTATVNATDSDDTELQYGYSTSNSSSSVSNWQSENSFSELDFGTYYFFVKDSKGAISNSYLVEIKNTAKEITVDSPVTDYVVGDSFKEGGTIHIVRQDGTEEDLPITEDMLSGLDTSTPGVKEVTVTYEGVTDTYEITVAPQKPVIDGVSAAEGGLSLIVSSSTSGEYYYGYSTSSDVTTVTNWQDSNSFLPLEDGEYYFFMQSKYDESVVSDPYEYLAEGLIYPTSIKVSGTTEIVDLNSEFDGKGTISVEYTNGTTAELPITSDMLTGFDTTTEGQKTVTVTYKDVTDTFGIVVIDFKEVDLKYAIENENEWTKFKVVNIDVVPAENVAVVKIPEGELNKTHFNYLIKENGNYLFSAESVDGYSKDSELITVTKIDNEAPVIIVGYNADWNRVLIDVIDNGELDRVVLPGGEIYYPNELPIVLDVEGITVGTITAYDKAGNISHKDFNITSSSNNVGDDSNDNPDNPDNPDSPSDMKANTFLVVGDNGVDRDWTNQNVNVSVYAYSVNEDISHMELTDSNSEEVLAENFMVGIDGVNTDTVTYSMQNNYSIGENGVYTYEVKTESGSATNTLIIDTIDKEAPSVVFSLRDTALNLSFTDNLSGIQLIEIDTLDSTFIEEDEQGVSVPIVKYLDLTTFEDGEYKIVLTDYAGNKSITTFKVENGTVDTSDVIVDVISNVVVTFDTNAIRTNISMSPVIKQLESGSNTKVITFNSELLPEKTRFLGWNTEEDGSGVNYMPGDVLENITSDMTLYLQTEKIVYHTITINGNNSGAKDVSTTLEEGTTYTFPSVTVSKDKVLKGFAETVDGEVKYNVGDIYVVNSDVVFYVISEAKPAEPTPPPSYPSVPSTPTITKYAIKILDVLNGSVVSNKSEAQAGETVKLTVTADKNYELKEIVIKEKNGDIVSYIAEKDGSYTFKMPKSNVIVSAIFEKVSTNPNTGVTLDCPRNYTCPMAEYVDMSPRDWYHDGVHYAIENGLMTGYGNRIFKPNDNLTRAMIVTILWRLDGSEKVKNSLSFNDIENNSWYVDGLKWAEKNGIVEGYSATKFGPNDILTREQMVTILWRYAQYKGISVSTNSYSNISLYRDVTTVSSYAYSAMEWACSKGLVTGFEDNTLRPQASTTRAQMATIIYRYLANIK